MQKSVFAADLRVYGDVTSKGDLDIHGHVEGSVAVKALTVSKSASVEGEVRSLSADIAGRIDGRLDSDRVAIESTGRIDGDISYKTLSMVVGGELNAHCIPKHGGATAVEESAPPLPAVARSASKATAATGRASTMAGTSA